MSYFNFKRKRNTGYTERDNGTRISCRAYDAECDGKFTAGKFRTVYGVSKKDFEVLVILGVIITKEWHHTGSSYKKSDYYEWKDRDFLDIYIDRKAEVSKLADAYVRAEWMYEQQRYICHVPTLEDYMKGEYWYCLDDYLTDAEKKQRDFRHNEISGMVNCGYSSHDRYLMHTDVDNEYNEMAIVRMKDDSKRIEAYNHKYGNTIATNEQRRLENDTINKRNLATNGRESILMSIAQIFFEDEDMYAIVYESTIAYRKKVEQDERDAKADAERKAAEKAYNERRAVAEKKQQAYLSKCMKAGKASRFFREITTDDLCSVELIEMNGKYGWFVAKMDYNLTKYYTGIRFTDKRTLNHYNKLGIA